MLKDLQHVMARPDILTQIPRIRKDMWEHIVRDPSDILLISQGLLPKHVKARIAHLQAQEDSPAVVVLSDHADFKEHATLLAEGCDAVLHTGLALEQIRDVIDTMLEKRRRQTRKQFFATQPLAEPRLSDFVSQSPGMATFMRLVPRVVRSNTSLLIEGETGVGKERLACAIHAEGLRAGGRFVALNCGALPEHLLESELFGHVRGAFTGATAARRGWFEIAHRGTLFLDEVGEIPLHLQVKLLRVLQEHEIQPVGGEKSFGVDVRIIAASNRPLEEEVEAKRFRRDLFHRLSVVTVTIPPLRERSEDIPTLVNKHITYIARLMNRHITGIAPRAMAALCHYTWPGNVRELNNVLERAILLCDDSEIAVEDLPGGIVQPSSRGPVSEPVAAEIGRTGSRKHNAHAESFSHTVLPEQWLSVSLANMRKLFLTDLERQYIIGLLTETHGKINAAAKRAGVPQRSLYEKMQQFNLRKEDFRSDSKKPASPKK